MKNVLLFIWQLPQNILGYIFFMFKKNIVETEELNGLKIFWVRSKKITVICFGRYSFINEVYKKNSFIKDNQIGMSKASEITGPFYLLIVLIPLLFKKIILRIRILMSIMQMTDINEWYFKTYPNNLAFRLSLNKDKSIQNKEESEDIKEGELIRLDTRSFSDGGGSRLFLLQNTSEEDLSVILSYKSSKQLNLKVESKKGKVKDIFDDFDSLLMERKTIGIDRGEFELNFKKNTTYRLICGGSYPFVLTINHLLSSSKGKFNVLGLKNKWEIR